MQRGAHFEKLPSLQNIVNGRMNNAKYSLADSSVSKLWSSKRNNINSRLLSSEASSPTQPLQRKRMATQIFTKPDSTLSDFLKSIQQSRQYIKEGYFNKQPRHKKQKGSKKANRSVSTLPNGCERQVKGKRRKLRTEQNCGDMGSLYSSLQAILDDKLEQYGGRKNCIVQQERKNCIVQQARNIPHVMEAWRKKLLLQSLVKRNTFQEDVLKVEEYTRRNSDSLEKYLEQRKHLLGYQIRRM